MFHGANLSNMTYFENFSCVARCVVCYCGIIVLSGDNWVKLGKCREVLSHLTHSHKILSSGNAHNINI